ncbi:hypothetical protein EZV62_006526 [Acer yangbiense]|uniref:Uncharacterized protein n=1 Tax=Acer yangbiense TaxID=1000413 RepID=A0A5C7I7W5_9ROSI|nr:hypothetical protein EZV62_006526 [Acer yangbiense]
MSVNAFKDPWIPRPSTFKPISCDPGFDVCVSPLIDRSRRGWNSEALNHFFIPADRAAIRSILVSWNGGHDCLRWHFDKSGEFTVRSGYRLAFSEKVRESTSNPVSQQNWCNRASETATHALFGCKEAIWEDRNSLTNYGKVRDLVSLVSWATSLHDESLISRSAFSSQALSPVDGIHTGLAGIQNDFNPASLSQYMSAEFPQENVQNLHTQPPAISIYSLNNDFGGPGWNPYRFSRNAERFQPCIIISIHEYRISARKCSEFTYSASGRVNLLSEQ